MRNPIPLSKIPDADTFITSPGSRFRTVYAPVIENGSITLTENGKEDTQVLIDSFRESTDMSFIMARLMAGDDRPLHANPGFYADVSNMSRNPAEMLQHIMDSRAYFDSLPEEIRANFDNSFANWFGSAGSPDWVTAMTTKKAAEASAVIEKAVEKGDDNK